MQNAWNLYRKLRNDDNPYYYDILPFKSSNLTWPIINRFVHCQDVHVVYCQKEVQAFLQFDQIDLFQSNLSKQECCGQHGKAVKM